MFRATCLTLTLFVTCILANDPNDALAPDYTALVAHFFY